jgi:hypothetical protein
VGQLFAETVRQARQSAHLHSHREVLPFHKRSAHMGGVRIPASHSGYNLRELWWGVPPVGAVVLPVVPKQLCELREININSEALGNGLSVKVESVSRKLDAVSHPLRQFPAKHLRRVHRAFSDHVRGDELCVGVHRNENPLIANLIRRFPFADVFVFLHNERENFVRLYSLAARMLHPFAHYSIAPCSGFEKQVHDRVAIQPRHSLCAANGATLNQALNRSCREFGLRDHRGSRQLCVRFAESGTAGSAAPTLNPALTEVPKLFAVVVLASTAGHGFSPLDFCGEKPENHFGSGLRLTPRSGLAPQPVSAGSGALNVKGYPLGWTNGYFHRWTVGSEANHDHDLHCFPPFYRAVFSALRGLYLKSLWKLPHISDSFFLVQIPLDLIRIHQPLQSGLNCRQRLRVVIKVEAAGLKVISNIVARQLGLVSDKNIGDRICERRGFTLGVSDLCQNLLPLRFIGEKANQATEKNSQFNDAFVILSALCDALLQFFSGFVNYLPCI